MKRAGIRANIREYIANYLQFRWSPRVQQPKCGLSQGDALSSILYVLSVNPILEILSSKYDVISYADDILLGVDANANIDEIIQEA